MASHAASTAAVWFSCSMLYIDHHVAGCHFSGYVWIPAIKHSCKQIQNVSSYYCLSHCPFVPPIFPPQPSSSCDGRQVSVLTVACLRICCCGGGTFGTSWTIIGRGRERREGGEEEEVG